MVYDLAYYERTLCLNSATAKDICEIRWQFVHEAKAKTVLDYGSGVGWFRAFRPFGVVVDTYDIGVAPQTGINKENYDLITLWDVLEHIMETGVIKLYLEKAKWAAVTVPILPPGKYLHEWKHYKPGEHVRYYTEETLFGFFGSCGFKLVKSEQVECPPREDIVSALFKRNKWKN